MTSMTYDNLTHAAIKHLMKQLAPLLISSGHRMGQVEEIVKQSLVEYACETLSTNNEKTTQSRVSLMTGVHRKDVKRLMSSNQAKNNEHKSANVSDKVISEWLGNCEYLTPDKNPKPLPARSSSACNLTTLIESACGTDIPVKTVIDELMRLKLIEKTGDDFTLVEDNLYKELTTEDKIQFFARNTGRHIQASVENILASPAPHLERAVYHDALTKEQVHELRKNAEKAIDALLKDINQKAIAFKKINGETPNATHKMHLGALYYADNTDKNQTGHDDDASEE